MVVKEEAVKVVAVVVAGVEVMAEKVVAQVKLEEQLLLLTLVQRLVRCYYLV